MTLAAYQVKIILPIKSKMAAARKQCFFAISVFLLNLHLRHSKSEVYK